MVYGVLQRAAAQCARMCDRPLGLVRGVLPSVHEYVRAPTCRVGRQPRAGCTLQNP